MKNLSKLGIILTSIFSFLLLALISQLFYLLWRRRQQSRRKINQIKPTNTTIPSTPTNFPSTHIEFYKLEGSYSPPSRVLFTIKEEEKEDDLVSSDDRKYGVCLNEHFGDDFRSQLDGADSVEVIIMVNDSDFDVEPPFVTPCDSPPYFTPSPSPTRESG
ncbi:uncharacterized protein LOC130827793 [Amaranthus tricolor]|uniref:uncharacterized protein LOC130827793 n=1 Tax=Amaranthus tricolor TaxID=29722 RepID=UPI002590CCBC|nr:uncharacterized protein LOC130827793 [Amaranthus tricolor]